MRLYLAKLLLALLCSTTTYCEITTNAFIAKAFRLATLKQLQRNALSPSTDRIVIHSAAIAAWGISSLAALAEEMLVVADT